MKNKKFLIITIVLTICITQHISFLLIGIPSLPNKILQNDKFLLNQYEGYDSVFVRGYFTSDCNVGEPKNHFSIDLNNKQNLIKKSLKINHLQIANIASSTWEDTTSNNYDIYYETYATSSSGWKLYDGYTCKLIEKISFPKGHPFYKDQTEIKYVTWILFFWWES